MASKTFTSFQDRLRAHGHLVAQKLFAIAHTKQSNLIISAGVRNTKDLLYLAKAAGPYIAVFKTHIDMVSDFNDETVKGLISLKKEHNFLVFEDRKFVDIGSTVQKQYHGGALRISEWADIVNVSPLAGPDIVRALSEETESPEFKESIVEPRALLILAEMTTEGSMACGQYTIDSIKAARAYHRSVIGFVAKGSLNAIDAGFAPEFEDMLVFTTGVNADVQSDQLGQTYQTPDEAIAKGSDFIIVGRGIYQSAEPVETALQRYRDLSWAAYEKRLSKAYA